MITYKCSGCGSSLGSAEALAGRMDVCPKCKTANLIPNSSTAPGVKEASAFASGIAGKVAFGVVSAALVCCLGFLLLSRGGGEDDQIAKNELAALQAKTASVQAERDELKRKVAALTAAGDQLKRENETLRADYRSLAAGRGTAERSAKPEKTAAIPPIPKVAAAPVTAAAPVATESTPVTTAPVPEVKEAPVSADEGKAPPATSVASAETAKAPLAKTMPKAEQEKIRRMVSWLQRNITCISCGGKGVISGNVCGDCAAKVSFKVTSRRQEATGYRIWNPITHTYSPEMVWREFEEEREKGNGKTPIEKLRPTMSLIVGLYQQYLDTMPGELKSLAKGVCLQIDKELASDFAAPEPAAAPAPATTPAPVSE